MANFNQGNYLRNFSHQEVVMVFQLADTLREDNVEDFLQFYDSIPSDFSVDKVDSIKEMARQLAAMTIKPYNMYKNKWLKLGANAVPPYLSVPCHGNDNLLVDTTSETNKLSCTDNTSDEFNLSKAEEELKVEEEGFMSSLVHVKDGTCDHMMDKLTENKGELLCNEPELVFMQESELADDNSLLSKTPPFGYPLSFNDLIDSTNKLFLSSDSGLDSPPSAEALEEFSPGILTQQRSVNDQETIFQWNSPNKHDMSGEVYTSVEDTYKEKDNVKSNVMLPQLKHLGEQRMQNLASKSFEMEQSAGVRTSPLAMAEKIKHKKSRKKKLSQDIFSDGKVSNCGTDCSEVTKMMDGEIDKETVSEIEMKCTEGRKFHNQINKLEDLSNTQAVGTQGSVKGNTNNAVVSKISSSSVCSSNSSSVLLSDGSETNSESSSLKGLQDCHFDELENHSEWTVHSNKRNKDKIKNKLDIKQHRSSLQSNRNKFDKNKKIDHEKQTMNKPHEEVDKSTDQEVKPVSAEAVFSYRDILVSKSSNSGIDKLAESTAEKVSTKALNPTDCKISSHGTGPPCTQSSNVSDCKDSSKESIPSKGVMSVEKTNKTTESGLTTEKRKDGYIGSYFRREWNNVIELRDTHKVNDRDYPVMYSDKWEEEFLRYQKSFSSKQQTISHSNLSTNPEVISNHRRQFNHKFQRPVRRYKDNTYQNSKQGSSVHSSVQFNRKEDTGNSYREGEKLQSNIHNGTVTKEHSFDDKHFNPHQRPSNRESHPSNVRGRGFRPRRGRFMDSHRGMGSVSKENQI